MLGTPSTASARRIVAASRERAGWPESTVIIERAEGSEAPVIEFFQLVTGGFPPERADASALGQLPTRAFRYCEAVRSASAFGSYLYPPIGFRLMLDDGLALFGLDGDGEWFPLHDAVQFPGFSDRFGAAAPARVKGYAPPWLGQTETPAVVQVWSGVIARTRADWSLLIRAPVNVARSQGVEILEGIIETDRWFGPLFSNLRILRPDAPFYFPAHRPLFQVCPIPRAVYGELPFSIGDPASMTKREWTAYHQTVIAPNRHRPGAYAGAVRKRRHSEEGT
jgi:Family of unknown function (DUF6065)